MLNQRIPQIFTLILIIRQNQCLHTKGIKKRKLRKRIAKLDVGVDGFEPPTLCL